MKNYHNIQLSILQKLLFAQSLKHSQLKIDDMPNSQLKFHIDELIKEGLIEKNDLYSLTQKGKEFSNRIKTENTTSFKSIMMR